MSRWWARCDNMHEIGVRVRVRVRDRVIFRVMVLVMVMVRVRVSVKVRVMVRVMVRGRIYRDIGTQCGTQPTAMLKVGQARCNIVCAASPHARSVLHQALRGKQICYMRSVLFADRIADYKAVLQRCRYGQGRAG